MMVRLVAARAIRPPTSTCKTRGLLMTLKVLSANKTLTLPAK